jgi:hypothetical protein
LEYIPDDVAAHRVAVDGRRIDIGPALGAMPNVAFAFQRPKDGEHRGVRERRLADSGGSVGNRCRTEPPQRVHHAMFGPGECR